VYAGGRDRTEVGLEGKKDTNERKGDVCWNTVDKHKHFVEKSHHVYPH
jgi:hypothetical protein